MASLIFVASSYSLMTSSGTIVVRTMENTLPEPMNINSHKLGRGDGFLERPHVFWWQIASNVILPLDWSIWWRSYNNHVLSLSDIDSFRLGSIIIALKVFLNFVKLDVCWSHQLLDSRKTSRIEELRKRALRGSAAVQDWTGHRRGGLRVSTRLIGRSQSGDEPECSMHRS